MRWDCRRDGCFNEKMRVKLDKLANCLPRRIAFTDVDGVTEVNGNLLFLEWKGNSTKLPTGQRLLYEKITYLCPAVAFVVEGNAKDMSVRSIRIYRNGHSGSEKDSSFDDLCKRIKEWGKWADKHPAKSKLRKTKRRRRKIELEEIEGK